MDSNNVVQKVGECDLSLRFHLLMKWVDIDFSHVHYVNVSNICFFDMRAYSSMFLGGYFLNKRRQKNLQK